MRRIHRKAFNAFPLIKGVALINVFIPRMVVVLHLFIFPLLSWRGCDKRENECNDTRLQAILSDDLLGKLGKVLLG